MSLKVDTENRITRHFTALFSVQGQSVMILPCHSSMLARSRQHLAPKHASAIQYTRSVSEVSLLHWSMLDGYYS